MTTIQSLQHAADRMREERDSYDVGIEMDRRKALADALKHVSSAISEIDEAALLVGGSFFDGSDEAVAACMRCGSPLEGDLCSDETCPYSEHVPDEPSKLAVRNPAPGHESVEELALKKYPPPITGTRRERVLKALAEGEWHKVVSVADRLGLGQENVGFTLRTLVADGLVEQRERRGPYRLVRAKGDGTFGASGPACPTGDQQLDQSEEEVPTDGPLA